MERRLCWLLQQYAGTLAATDSPPSRLTDLNRVLGHPGDESLSGLMHAKDHAREGTWDEGVKASHRESVVGGLES